MVVCYLPKLHGVGLCEDGLGCPSGKLEGIVLHLGGKDSTTLAGQLGSPVKGATATLGLVVKLVKSLDNQVLVFAIDVVLYDGVEFRPHDEVQRLFILI